MPHTLSKSQNTDIDLQKQHTAQSHPVQSRKSITVRSRKAPIRSQAVRIWWSDQARLPVSCQVKVLGKRLTINSKKAKTTKKVVLRLECTNCKTKAQLALKRCKHFELGYDFYSQTPWGQLTNHSPSVVTRRPRARLSCSRWLASFLARIFRAWLRYGAFGRTGMVPVHTTRITMRFCGRNVGND
jgi:hypothetical protein